MKAALRVKICFTKPYVLILWFCLFVCFSKHKDHLVEIALREMGHIWNEPHLSFGEKKVSSSGLKPISWRLGLDSLPSLLQVERIYLSVSLCVGLGMSPSPTLPYSSHLPHLRIRVYLRSAVVYLKIAYFEEGSKRSSIRKINLGKTGTETHSNVQ